MKTFNSNNKKKLIDLINENGINDIIISDNQFIIKLKGKIEIEDGIKFGFFIDEKEVKS